MTGIPLRSRACRISWTWTRQNGWSGLPQGSGPDGWALACLDVSYESKGATLPRLSQIEELESVARKRAKLRKNCEKGKSKARQEWLTWIALSGQLTDLEEARGELAALKIKEGSKKRATVEVAVIINEAQVSAGKWLLSLSKEAKGTVGKRLWPYFADGYRPENDFRDWAYLWSVLQYAENTGVAKDYKKAKDILEKKGACGSTKKDMEETLKRLKKRKR